MTIERAVASKGDNPSFGPAIATPIEEAGKAYARAALRLKISRAVWAMWDKLRKEEGIDQNWLVGRLGSNKGRVSRLLNSSGNWTLDTVADLLEAMECRLTFVEAKRYKEIDAASNVDPSLLGMRDYPNLWHIVTVTVHSDENVQPTEIDSFKEQSSTLRLSTRHPVVSSDLS